MNQARSSAILDANDIKNLWRIVTKNWYVLVICLSLSFAGAYFYTYRLTDIYAATMQILLKSNDVYDSKSIISSGSGYNFKDYTDNYNAMRVIKSYDLIRKTIDRMKLDVSYYIHGRIRTKEVYEAVPFEIVPGNISSGIYEQMMKFSILNTDEYEITYSKGGAEKSCKGRFNVPFSSPDFSLTVNKNPALRANTVKELANVEYLVQIHSRNGLVQKYQRSLNVEVPEYTGIVQVTVEDIIPKRAVTFLDTLGKVYIENTLESKLEVNGRTLTYIDRQLQELTGMMTSIEDKLQDYKQQEAILNLNKEEENYFNQLVNSQAQEKKMELQLSALNALEKYIIEDQEGEFLPPTFFLSSDDVYLQNSISELYKTQTQLNSLRFSATAKGPMILEMEAKLNRMKNDLLNYINNAKNAVLKQKEAITKQIRQSENFIGNIPFKQRELLNIERNLEVNQKMYSFLLEKKAENTIAKAGIVPESKVIESARSIGIVKPNKSQITYSFIGAGFLVAVLIILIRTSFYEKVESLDELKIRTQIPILGEVIFSEDVKEKDNLVVENEPRSVITESFRSIRTNLQFMVPKTGPSVYLFTSNNPGEGKTFCSVNLASLLGKGGKKVLLMEYDLHQPKVGQSLNMHNDIGLTTILIGRALPQDCIIKSNIENLDVILAGPAPPNASELILGEHNDELFKFARENYDYILVDTPPIGLITDALVLARFSDVNIFVINTKYPCRDSLNNANEVAREKKMKNFCLVLNGVKVKRSRYNYKRYGYGYGYGYGYTGQDKPKA